MKLSKQISNWIKQQVKKAAKKGVVVGLSGGIDSALTAVLAKKALGDYVLGLILPCASNPRDEKMTRKLAKKFDIKLKKIDLTDIYKRFEKVYPNAGYLAKANLKPRLRMVALYYLANSLDYLVAGTGNKSELMIGYFTKYGDGGCDILPLGDLLKTEVRKLARELEIPDEIIKRAPTAGLWDGQTDEGEIGMSYTDLDRCLRAIEMKRLGEVKEEVLMRTRLLIRNSRHKRNAIPIFKKK
jgi:NAD+ synthase